MSRLRWVTYAFRGGLGWVDRDAASCAADRRWAWHNRISWYRP